MNTAKNQHGGKRENATGRPRLPPSQKKQSVVIRVPADKAAAVRAVLAGDNSEVATLKTRLAQSYSAAAAVEMDAREYIARLESEMAVLRDNSEVLQLRQRVAQLSGELFPALKRLREIDHTGGW